MTNGDVLAEVDRAVAQTRRAIKDGTLIDCDYSWGLHDGLMSFRRYVRSERFEKMLNAPKPPTKETPKNV